MNPHFNPLLLRLGLTLAHTFWEAAAMAAALFLVLVLLRRAESGLRYAAAISGMACTLFVAAFTWTELPLHPVAGAFPVAAAVYIPADHFKQHDENPRRPLTPSSNAAVSIGAMRNWRLDPAIALTWLAVAWLAGVAAIALFRVTGWFVLSRRLSIETAPLDELWKNRLAALERNAGVGRAIRWLQSADSEVPYVFGWRRPTIVVPVAAQTVLPSRELEAVLGHELAHVRRGDYVMNLVQTAIETLFFYHPAVLWMSGQVRVERENCCDDLGARMAGSITTYAKALADLEAIRLPGGGGALAATGTSLLPRLRRLTGQGRSAIPFGGMLLAGLSAALLVLPFLSVKLLASTPPNPGSSIAPSANQLPGVDPLLKPYVPPVKPMGPDSQLFLTGSGTMGRLADPLIAKFVLINPGVYHESSLRGSAWVADQLGSGEYNIGLMSRPMNVAEHKLFRTRMKHDPIEIIIARDAIVVLVNKDNPIPGITLPQLDALYGTNRLAGYTGDVKTWGGLGLTGSWATVAVSPYGLLEEGQGTVETFRRIALKGGPINKNIHDIPFPENEFGQAVAKDPAGISYNIDHPPVEGAKAIGVAAKAGEPFIAASPETIADGSYPLSRGLYLYLADNTDKAANEFVKFVLSRDGQAVIARTGEAIPVPAIEVDQQLKDANIH